MGPIYQQRLQEQKKCQAMYFVLLLQVLICCACCFGCCHAWLQLTWGTLGPTTATAAIVTLLNSPSVRVGPGPGLACMLVIIYLAL